jgi:hypothetical protein
MSPKRTWFVILGIGLVGLTLIPIAGMHQSHGSAETNVAKTVASADSTTPATKESPHTPEPEVPKQTEPTKPATAIPDFVIHDESENHRIRIDPQSGNVIAVRSTINPVEPLRGVCRIACQEEWSSPSKVDIGDKPIEEYIPRKDIQNLTTWRMKGDWFHTPPFATTFYIRSKSADGWVQQLTIINTLSASATIVDTQHIDATGEAIDMRQPSGIPPVDLIEATDKNLVISWAVSGVVHALADWQSLLKGALQ